MSSTVALRKRRDPGSPRSAAPPRAALPAPARARTRSAARQGCPGSGAFAAPAPRRPWPRSRRRFRRSGWSRRRRRATRFWRRRRRAQILLDGCLEGREPELAVRRGSPGAGAVDETVDLPCLCADLLDERLEGVEITRVERSPERRVDPEPRADGPKLGEQLVQRPAREIRGRERRAGADERLCHRAPDPSRCAGEDDAAALQERA